MRKLEYRPCESELFLFELLRRALAGERKEAATAAFPSEACLEEAVELAQRHAVLPFLYDVIKTFKGTSAVVCQSAKSAARMAVRTNYRLLFLTKFVTGLLEANGITAIVLKGAATASFYPVPELRKSGDVDLLIPEQADFERACTLLTENGFYRLKNQKALHHVELKNDEGISVEVHHTLAEPFESRQINSFLKELLPEYGKNTVKNSSWGVPFYQPKEAYHAFYLLLHMLQHFLRSGFGLKYLCDWAVFWNREIAAEEKARFSELIQKSGTEGFVSVLTKCCVEYLGLKEGNVRFLLDAPPEEELVLEFLYEVLKGGEFGKEQHNRMVAMRGTGIFAYFLEFHHQMHLNYPKSGNIFLCWPVLWILTLARFLHNNRTIRKVSGREILREAGRRSRLVGRMKLFESGTK